MNSFFLPLLCIGFLMVLVYADKPKTYLITMTEEEMLKKVNCIAMSKMQELCDGLNKCGSEDNFRLYKYYDECDAKFNTLKTSNCNEKEYLYTGPDVPKKIYECANEKVQKQPLSEDEKKLEIKFEDCVKDLAAKASCK